MNFSSRIILSTMLVLLIACEKWVLSPESFPEVTTLHFEAGQNPTEGKLYGAISRLLDDGFVEKHGHVWSLTLDPLPSLENNIGQAASEKTGNGSYQSDINGLIPGTTYFYRAYIIYGNQPEYGTTRQFTTTPLTPSLEIFSISDAREETYKVKVVAIISNLPVGLPIQSYGITWGPDPLPEITSNPFVFEQSILAPNSAFQFESEFILPPGLSYLRPFLRAAEEAYYGNSMVYYTGNGWTQRTDFGGGIRSFSVGFSIGEKGYIGTGFDGENNQKDFWEYDPFSDQWSQKADFGGGIRFGAVGFSIGEKGYLGTGLNELNETTQDLWEYDTLTNTWARKADLEGNPRIAAVGFSIGQKGYIGTGFDGESTKEDFWEYDPATDTWVQKADFSGGPRTWAVGFSIGQKGYVGTGSLEEENQVLYIGSDFWEYDPESDDWEQKAYFGGEPRKGAAGFSIGQKGFIGTGDYFPTDEADFWEYDPQSNTWTQRADFGGEPRAYAVGFSIGQKGFIGTGWTSSFGGSQTFSDVWEYFPE
ncbi:MAG: hypothetical protein H6558_01950 [Lewinellaceae bacterium]|nr:hypothetical protein [Lewinellaceae bacterium]